MELAYYTAPTHRKVTALGLTSAGVSAAILVLPLACLLMSFIIARMLNDNSLLPWCDRLSQSLMYLLNTLVFAFPLTGLAVGMIGFFRSGRQCELSAATSLFNVMILATILAAGF